MSEARGKSSGNLSNNESVRDDMSTNVVWFEVMGKDADTMRAFYGELLGWNLSFDNPMSYAQLDTAEGQVGGGVGITPQGEGWSTFYLAVDDIQAHVERATALGGAVRLPAKKMPDGGWIAVVADPEGNAVGLYQTA